MARSGRDELELFLDEAPSVRAARAIVKSQDDVAKSMSNAAHTFDRSYAAAFQSIQRGSEATARKIKADADEFNAKLKASAGGGIGVGGAFAGGAAALVAVQAAQEILQFAQIAGQAYLEGNRAATALTATTDRYRLSLVETQAEVAKLRREYNMSQTEAERGLALSTQAAGRVGAPGQGGAYLAAGLNLAEYGGIDKQQVSGLLRQIASGNAEAFELLAQKDPAAVYRKIAEEAGRTVSSLTEAEKAQALFNATLEAGSDAIGAHRAHVDSAVGAWESWTAAIADFQRQAGEKGVGFLQWVLEGTAQGVERFATGQTGGPSKEWLAAQERENKRLIEEYAARANGPAEAAARLKAQQLQSLADLKAIQDYAANAREARDDGPFADIRRRTKAEVDRLLKAHTENGALSSVGAGQIAFAQAFGAEDEAKRALEINKQLGAQWDEMRAKYAGEGNPLTSIALNAKKEMDALLATIEKLGPGFERQAEAMISAASKLQDLNFAKGLVSSALDISNIQARMNELTPILTSAMAQGQYGQFTDQFTVRESYKTETDVERAKRLIDALDAERSASGGPEYERAARQALLAQTAGISAEALGADPTVRDRIMAELQAEKDARIKDVEEARALREAQLASMKKQDEAAEKTKAFHEGLEKSGLTGEEIGKALKVLSNLKVGVNLFVKSDREFTTAVADGTALDRVTTG